VTTEQVPAKEFRLRLAQFLDAARSGESFEVTRSGRPAARLVPPIPREGLPDDD
jgi:prevent-host-death family protein